MIDGHHALPISRQAQLAGMSRDSVYYVPQAVGAADLALLRRMDALYRKPGTSKKHLGHDVYPYLLRGLNINRANQVWALDTTYIPMAKCLST